jgi:hypothetical protein
VATSFPSGLDNFTNPTADDKLDTAGVLHDVQHSDVNDAVEALEAKVGVDSSAVTSSLTYKLSNTSGGHGHDGSDSKLLPTASPAASAVGDTAVTGTAATYSRTDHKHAREAFATPTSTGTANAAGAATTVPRSDHVHGIGYTGEATPVALGAAAVGASTVPARSNHVHPTTGVVLDSGAQTVAGVKTFSSETVALNAKIDVTTLATSGTVDLAFSGAGFRTQALAGNTTFTFSALAAGRSVTVRITSDGSSRTVTLPTGVKVLAGGATGAPPVITVAASKVGALTVTSFGTSAADCVAAWSVES